MSGKLYRFGLLSIRGDVKAQPTPPSEFIVLTSGVRVTARGVVSALRRRLLRAISSSWGSGRLTAPHRRQRRATEGPGGGGFSPMCSEQTLTLVFVVVDRCGGSRWLPNRLPLLGCSPSIALHPSLHVRDERGRRQGSCRCRSPDSDGPSARAHGRRWAC